MMRIVLTSLSISLLFGTPCLAQNPDPAPEDNKKVSLEAAKKKEFERLFSLSPEKKASEREKVAARLEKKAQEIFLTHTAWLDAVQIGDRAGTGIAEHALTKGVKHSPELRSAVVVDITNRGQNTVSFSAQGYFKDFADDISDLSPLSSSGMGAPETTLFFGSSELDRWFGDTQALDRIVAADDADYGKQPRAHQIAQLWAQVKKAAYSMAKLPATPDPTNPGPWNEFRNENMTSWTSAFMTGELLNNKIVSRRLDKTAAVVGKVDNPWLAEQDENLMLSLNPNGRFLSPGMGTTTPGIYALGVENRLGLDPLNAWRTWTYDPLTANAGRYGLFSLAIPGFRGSLGNPISDPFWRNRDLGGGTASPLYTADFKPHLRFETRSVPPARQPRPTGPKVLGILEGSRAMIDRYGSSDEALGRVILARGGDAGWTVEPDIRAANRDELNAIVGGLQDPRTNPGVDVRLRDFDHCLNAWAGTVGSALKPDRDDWVTTKFAKNLGRSVKAFGVSTITLCYNGVKAVDRGTGTDIGGWFGQDFHDERCSEASLDGYAHLCAWSSAYTSDYGYKDESP